MGEEPAAETLADELRSSGFDVNRVGVAEQQAVVARRSEVLRRIGKARVHTFIVVFSVHELELAPTEALADAAQKYANKHKGGLPRGLQNGTLTIPIFLCERSSDAAGNWFRQEPTHGFAALRLPVLADASSDELVYFTGKWSRGYLYRDYILDFVRDTIAPALGRSAPAEEPGT